MRHLLALLGRAFSDGVGYEQCCWGTKEGELSLNRVKSEDTLVQARSGSDVRARAERFRWQTLTK